MEFETKIFLFFLLFWSFSLQMILTFSASCYDTLERWVPFWFYMFATLLFCIVRYHNYRKYQRNGILNNYNYNTYNNI